MSSIALTISIAALLLFHPAQTTPIHRQPHLECRCQSQTSPTLSPDSLTTPCALQRTESLDWLTAAKFAKEHDIPMHFESCAAASRVLSHHQPLPTNVLMALSSDPSDEEPTGAEIHLREERFEQRSKIVCSLKSPSSSWIAKGLEVEERRRLRDEDHGECDVFLLQIVLWVIALVVGYEAAEMIWFCVRRGIAFRTGTIRLSGEEKELKVDDAPQTSKSLQVAALASLPAYMAPTTPRLCKGLHVTEKD